jgi:outer membrane immunogenic protein
MRWTLLSTMFALALGGSVALGQPADPMSDTSPTSESSGVIPVRCANGIDLRSSCGCCGPVHSDCYHSTTSCCGSNSSCCCANRDWEGAYIGVHLGFGMDSSSASETWTWTTNFPTGSLIGINGGPLLTTTAPNSFNTVFRNQYQHSSKGLLGGVDAGYNWQFSGLVFGVEADYDLSTQGDTVSYSAQPVAGVFPPLPNFFFIPGTTQGWSSKEKIDWLATFRGRLGVTTESTLWYLTGGLALGGIETSYDLTSSPGATGITVPQGAAGPGSFAQFGLPGGVAGANFDNTKVGWCVGAGVESKILQRLGWGNGWTLRFEYLFVDLGTVNHTFGTPLVPVSGANAASQVTGSTSFTSSLHVEEQIIRVGLNYKF